MGANRINGRDRVLYAGFVASNVAAGVMSRRYGDALPPFVAAYLPDALYALMVFLAIGFLFPKAHTGRVALGALLFCYAVEASQLYQADWLNAIRQTRLGGLALGFGFLWSDILCYTAGIAAGAAFEWMQARTRRKL